MNVSHWVWLGVALFIVFGALFNGLIAVLKERQRRRAMRIDPDAPCPSCGHRNGKLQFSEEMRLCLHVCQVCGARWGEDTVVRTDDWQRKGASA